MFTREENKSAEAVLCHTSLNTFYLRHLVPSSIPPTMARGSVVLSRLLALPGAPQNSLSRLIGGVFDWLRKHDRSVETVLTYNNPNLGFRGTIYRATNWQMLGFEDKRPDMLLDGDDV